MNAQLDGLKFDAQGLIAAIIQDALSGQVLAMFWMNRAALEKTLETGFVHSFSRSRNRLAKKGEVSGHVEKVQAMLTDCDRDVVLFKVQQEGAACHEGYYSCFFRQYQAGGADWQIIAEKVFEPDEVYKNK